jgi:hypothetical protein
MPRRLVLSGALLAAAIFAAALRAQDAASPIVDPAVLAPVGEGWAPIWGKTLAGWKAEPEYWKIDEDGSLHGRTPGEELHHYAWTEKEYADFELHADFKLVGYNSGICIRIAPTSHDNVPGYQVDIGDGYWGSLWDERGRGMVAEFPKDAAEKTVKRDDWNHYYIRAEGHHIQAWLNGVKTFDVVDDKGLLTGPIGFQLTHGVGRATDITYKNVVVRPIKTAGPATP